MVDIDASRLRILFPDTYGMARGKYVPIAAAHGSLTYSVTIFGVGYDRELIAAPGAAVLDGMGDVVATYDPAAARPGWEDATSVCLADLSRGGEPLAISPRVALSDAVGDLAQLGYRADVGVELEAYVLQPRDGGGWEPWDTPHAHCYGTGPTVDPVGLVDDIMAAAHRTGIELETVGSEYDTPQFELTTRYRDAVGAIDDAFLLKLLCREIAMRHGLLLTFLGRPLGDRGGSGLHVNISLTDADGENLFDDPAGDDGLSDLARRSMAGMLAHHEALTALCAPTVNAYRRLQPGQLSGYWANWGHDHRSVAVRVPADRGSGTRLESRLPDGAANPYLATAALLRAMLSGLTGDAPLPAPETGDGLETANTERCCPENLSLALDALEADATLVTALGPALVEHFVALKRDEWRRFSRAVTDWELDTYLAFH